MLGFHLPFSNQLPTCSETQMCGAVSVTVQSEGEEMAAVLEAITIQEK